MARKSDPIWTSDMPTDTQTLVNKAQMLDLEKNDTNRLALLDEVLKQGGSVVTVQISEDVGRPHVYIMNAQGEPVAIGRWLKDAIDNYGNTLAEVSSATTGPAKP